MLTYKIIIIYLILECLWIYTLTPLLYRRVYETIQGQEMKPKMFYAIWAYILLIICFVYVCEPLSKQYKHKWLAYGLVGLIVYGIYNCTNGALFTHYDYKMVLVDTLWGTIIFTFIGYLAQRR